MKTILKIILSILLAYILSSFIKSTFNPFELTEGHRAIMIIMAIAIFIAINIFSKNQTNKLNKKEEIFNESIQERLNFITIESIKEREKRLEETIKKLTYERDHAKDFYQQSLNQIQKLNDDNIKLRNELNEIKEA